MEVQCSLSLSLSLPCEHPSKNTNSPGNSRPVFSPSHSPIMNNPSQRKARQIECKPVNPTPKSPGVCRKNLPVCLPRSHLSVCRNLSVALALPLSQPNPSLGSLARSTQTLCTTTQTGGMDGVPRLPVQPMLESEQPARSPAYSIVVPCRKKKSAPSTKKDNNARRIAMLNNSPWPKPHPPSPQPP
jgi:hypothetical protein